MRVQLLDIHKETKDNKQFEILLVPGGMIVYRTSFLHSHERKSKLQMSQTATFVPLCEPIDDKTKRFLYGEL